MTQAQSADEKIRLKKQWTDQAIQQALASQWEEAVITNKNILSIYPTEAEAYNRLGKAYSELGQYAEARQAYSQTLKYSPNNTIAKKNLGRLSLLQEEPAQTHSGTERIDPRLFIEETGKTGMTELINLAPSSVLGKVSFPSQGVGDTIRAYTKDSMLRYDREDEDELGNEDEYYDGGEEIDDMTEIDLESGIEGEE